MYFTNFSCLQIAINILAYVYSTTVAILYGASRELFSDNCQNKVQKPTIITNRSRKRSPWCELIYLYIFSLSMCFTIRHGKRLGDVKAPETEESRELQGLGQRLGSCNVSSRSRKHKSRVSIRSQLRRSRAYPCSAYIYRPNS